MEPLPAPFSDPPSGHDRLRLLAGLLFLGLGLALGLMGLRWLVAAGPRGPSLAGAPPEATVITRTLAEPAGTTRSPTAPPEAFVPILPIVDQAMKGRLQAIHARGLAQGMRPEVLAKVGDSITVYGSFLTELGCGGANLGDYGHLAPTIAYFGSTELPPTLNYSRCAEHNSWTRVGPAARVGWSAVHALRTFPTADPYTATADVDLPLDADAFGSDEPGPEVGASGAMTETVPLAADAARRSTISPGAGATAGITLTHSGVAAAGQVTATAALTATVRPPPPTPTPPPECQAPDDTPLRCEIKVIRPGVAIVMFGTNDLEAGVPLDTYRANLDRIMRELLAAGVIPILSTIPPRTDEESANARVSRYNAVVMDVAADHGMPLLNYWRALSGPEMVHQGMDWDGIHPNAMDHGASFTARGLRYGQNQRNLTLLQTLDKIRRIVYEDGAAEG